MIVVAEDKLRYRIERMLEIAFFSFVNNGGKIYEELIKGKKANIKFKEYDKIYNVTNFRFCCLWKTFEGTVLQMMMEGEMIEHVMCMEDEIGKIIFYKNYYNTIDKNKCFATCNE